MAGTMAASPPPRSAPMHLTARLTALILTCLLVLAGCANSGPAANALDESQYAWSGAIRWGDFGGALNLVDPEVRKADPLTDLERKRYEQIKISSYRDVGAEDRKSTRLNSSH